MTKPELSESQLLHFDVEYVGDDLWESIWEPICSRLPLGAKVLDVGGGNGLFSDRLLAARADIEVTVVEPSTILLSKNRQHARKHLMPADIAAASEILESESFDLICVNWVLHHVLGEGLAGSRAAQRESLNSCKRLLKAGGLLSILENSYTGWRFLPPPGFVIYMLTSSRLLAPLTKLGGANTSGVGVLFRSANDWREEAALLGLQMLHSRSFEEWSFPTLKRLTLNLKSVCVCHQLYLR